MAFNLVEVQERIGPAQLAGVDQTHEQVAYIRAAAGLEKQGVLAVQDGTLQRPFADVVVQRRTGHAQKQCQLFPVLQHVGNRRAQRGVRLH